MRRTGADPDPAQLSLFGDEAPASRLGLPGPSGGSSPSSHPGRPGPAAPALAANVPVTGSGPDPIPPAPVRSPVAGSDPPALAPATFRHPKASRETTLAGHRVAYEFRRSRRRTIGFVVGPEGLTVSAPRWVGSAEVDAALREKARWILRKLQEQADRARRLAQARIDWHDGTAVPYLGETLIVVVDPRVAGAELHTAEDTLPGVPRLTLHVGVSQSAAPEQIREAVQGWLQRRARAVFEDRCTEFSARLGVQVHRLTLSSASTRWGSASVDGSIRLNWRLIHFGLPVIDYVVVHELAHLRVMDHSPRFWDVVGSLVPDYRSRRAALQDESLARFD